MTESAKTTITPYNIPYVYVRLFDGCEWEDNVIFLNAAEAIEESIKRPRCRVEIFAISKEGGYRPTYMFYEKGQLFNMG